MKYNILISLLIILESTIAYGQKLNNIGNYDVKLSSLQKEIAPDSSKSDSYDKALEHAPILWFSDYEKYYPVLPFFSAFDGIDNGGDPTKIDFDDINEIAPTDSENENSVSWDTLISWYDQFPDSTKKQIINVFYKIDSTKARNIGNILESDEQFWQRIDDKLRQFLRSEKTIIIYKYYFYYVRDKGLQGHPHDFETLHILLPQDSSNTFRMVLGVGHSRLVSNNVLVYDQMEINSLYSKRYGSNFHILVELGGHSNAPDINANGLFEKGFDSNWHIRNLWGTRDIQAVGGIGALGEYEPWMTFPRDSINKVFPPDSSKYSSKNLYKLRSLDKFKMLDSLLQILDKRKSESKIIDSTDVKNIKESFQNIGLQPKGIKRINNSIIERLFLWRLKPNVWKDKGDKPFEEELFRKHLFRPRFIQRKLFPPRGLGSLGVWYGFEFSEKPIHEYGLTWIIPAVFWLPLKTDGILEFHAGIQDISKRIITELYYERFYGRLFSWYGNLSYKNLQKSQNWSIGIGFSISGPPLYDPINWIKLRIGLRSYIADNSYQLKRFKLQFQIGFHR